MRSCLVHFHFCIQYIVIMRMTVIINNLHESCNDIFFFFLYMLFCLCWLYYYYYSHSFRTHGCTLWRHHSHFINIKLYILMVVRFLNFSSEFISFFFSLSFCSTFICIFSGFNCFDNVLTVRIVKHFGIKCVYKMLDEMLCVSVSVVVAMIMSICATVYACQSTIYRFF